jgi:hypothetical protein
MSRPTAEEIAWEVAQCRGMDKKFPVSRPDSTGVIVALADDLDAAKAEITKLTEERDGRYAEAVEAETERDKLGRDLDAAADNPKDECVCGCSIDDHGNVPGFPGSSECKACDGGCLGYERDEQPKSEDGER